MLSYRHAFHAGNHADVLKHTALCLLLERLTLKDKPLTYIDTHAGAGLYDLTSPMAVKLSESTDGVSLALKSRSLTDLCPAYALTVETCGEEFPHCYPGSPYFASRICRGDDHLRLFELHPADYELLRAFCARDGRISAQKRDGLAALTAVLPPKPRRGLCLIDPPYEDQEEYGAVLKALRTGLKRWPEGVFMLWYPLISRHPGRAPQLVRGARDLGAPLLNLTFQREFSRPDGGLYGSGVLVFNYPYGSFEDLKALSAILPEVLGGAGTESECRILNPAT